MPATTNDSTSPGPAYWFAARPVRTKMPAPMMQPMPSAVSVTGSEHALQAVLAGHLRHEHVDSDLTAKSWLRDLIPASSATAS
jgi:hypothetical protein